MSYSGDQPDMPKGEVLHLRSSPSSNFNYSANIQAIVQARTQSYIAGLDVGKGAHELSLGNTIINSMLFLAYAQLPRCDNRATMTDNPGG